MKITRGLVLSLLAPGVVCLLVAVQIAYGLRGFDHPRGGAAAVLEVPGLLVGWGALFFLVPLLVWLVLDWWGVTFSGIALKCLGATAVSIAVGSMFGIVGGVAAGGHLGAGLAGMLTATLGTPVSLILLGLMALPGFTLTCLGFLQHGEGQHADGQPRTRTTPPAKPKPAAEKPPTPAREKPSKPAASPAAPASPTPASTAPATATPASTASVSAPPAATSPVSAPPASKGADDGAPRKRSVFKRRKKVSNLADLVRDSAKRLREPGEPWYPGRQFDEHGNEMPMDFGEHRDVGGIRYADPDPEPERESPPESEDGAESASGASAGLAEGVLAEAIAEAERVLPETGAEATADTDSDRILPTIPELFAGDYDPDALEQRLAERDAGPETLVVPGSAREGEDRSAQAVGPVVGSAEPQEEPLMPGVRWADPPAPDPARASLSDKTPAEGVEIVAREPEPEQESEFDEEDEAIGALLRQTPTAAEPEEDVEAGQTPSVKDSVLQALDGEAHTQSSKRYLQKLEASGIFDFMEASGPDPTPPGKPTKKAASKKTAPKRAPTQKATSKKKAPAKKSAKKKAAPKQASKKKAPAKKSAKKKPATTRKASAVRKPEAQPVVKKKPAPPATVVKDGSAAEAPTTPRDQWRTGSWRHGPHGAHPSARKQERETVSESVRRRVIRERRDPHFTRAAEVCLERGAASPVLLTRRLGIGFHQAKSLVERLVSAGVLGRMTPRGSRPTIMTPAQWPVASR